MGFAIIQQDDQVAGYLTQKMAKEEGHFLALDIVLI